MRASTKAKSVRCWTKWLFTYCDSDTTTKLVPSEVRTRVNNSGQNQPAKGEWGHP